MRGFAAKHAPFVFSAWKHAHTLEILSKLAGVDLAVNIDYELGHVNFGVGSNRKLMAMQAPGERLDSALTVAKGEVVGWRKDSYPFSATLMLSDSTGTTGGELAIKLEDGQQHKLGKPHTGDVVLIQGRHLLHTGLKAYGPNVRMTMVTPLWPSYSFVQDETFLTYVAAISDISELYSQYADYRFRMLIDRLQAQRHILREQGQMKLDIGALKDFISEQVEFLAFTNGEILDGEAVHSWGYKPASEIPESVLMAQTTET